MDTIVFYRGIDQLALDTLEFKWRAPDGTEALGITFGSFHRLNFWRYVYLPYIIVWEEKFDKSVEPKYLLSINSIYGQKTEEQESGQ